MLKPRHDLIGVQSAGMTPRRAMILGTVAMLHVLAVYALISGMAATVINRIGTDIVVTKIEPATQPKPIPIPPKPTIEQPRTPIAVRLTAPPVDIQTTPDDKAPPALPTDPGPKAPGKPQTLQVADIGPMGIQSTHTIPPYPALARRLGQQGTVHLQMTISALGEVTAATVMESSGSSDLDQAAIAWVMAHWKYKPALQGGAAMAGQTQAAIRFDLKQAAN